MRRFPHSDICGSTLICSSPQLFAACRVLRRLPVPRHSPCALFHLTFCEQPPQITKKFSGQNGFILCCESLEGIEHSRAFTPWLKTILPRFLFSVLFVGYSGMALATPDSFLSGNHYMRLKSNSYGKIAYPWPPKWVPPPGPPLCFPITSLRSILLHYSIFKVRVRLRPASPFPLFSRGKSGGLRWTRTIDLTLIRRAL